MEVTVKLSERELADAAMEYVSVRSKSGSLQVMPMSVTFATIEREHTLGTETTAQVLCELQDIGSPFKS